MWLKYILSLFIQYERFKQMDIVLQQLSQTVELQQNDIQYLLKENYHLKLQLNTFTEQTSVRYASWHVAIAGLYVHFSLHNRVVSYSRFRLLRQQPSYIDKHLKSSCLNFKYETN